MERAAEHALLSSTHFGALVDSTVDLELYMPVREHWTTWNGDAQLLVAFQLTTEDPVLAFDVQGGERELSAETPPEIPTLVVEPPRVSRRLG
jgi:hypothetical protein